VPTNYRRKPVGAGAGTGNLSLIRGIPPTFSRIEDPLLDDLPETVIDRYRNWASSVTDAPSQFHTLTSVVVLSTIVCPYTSLKTSFGEIRPNLWGMVLAGTTVTRKSTTMDIAMDFLRDLGIDFMLGTDGSPEGLMAELADRDGKVSLFHRDEITGWLQVTTKDYMIGILESLTRMYDGKEEKRVLRSATLEVKKPRLVILSGGIKTKMESLITMEHIASGFVPRFLFVCGSTTSDQMRPIGPPPDGGSDINPRDELLVEFQAIDEFWRQKPKTTTITVAGMTKKLVGNPEPRDVTASTDAWARIQQMKRDAVELGEASDNANLYTPILDRLSNSIIKVAILLAAARQSVIIDYTDVIQAIRYSQEWLDSVMDFVSNVEKQPDMNPWEKKADKIIRYIIKRHPKPVTRSEIMRAFHVRAKDIADVESTLIGRGHIRLKNVPNMAKHGGRTNRVEYSVANPVKAEDTLRVNGYSFDDGDDADPEAPASEL
jgi:hypothetical protein